MKRTLGATLVVAGLLGSSETMSQSVESFEPLSIDRPDVSNLPTTVRPGHYQFELGGEIGRGPFTREFLVPNLVFRTGLNRRSELRLGFNQLRVDSLGSKGGGNVVFASLSGKYRFVEEKGWRPSIAIQPEFSLPFGDGVNIRHEYPNYSLADYSLLFLFNNTVHKQVFINYNAGVFWSKMGRIDYLGSVSASFLHTHRLGYFLEAYTLIEKSEVPFSFDGGVMYLIRPRLQFDIYGGSRAIDDERSWFYGAGVGFRIDKDDLAPEDFRKTGVRH